MPEPVTTTLVAATTTIEPFGLYRFFVSIVLGGIWLYTLIDSLVTVRVATKRRKQERLARETRKRTESLGGPHRLRRERLDHIAAHAMRILRNLVILKVLELVSWKTIWRMRREVVLILVLLAANLVASWYFFTM